MGKLIGYLAAAILLSLVGLSPIHADEGNGLDVYGYIRKGSSLNKWLDCTSVAIFAKSVEESPSLSKYKREDSIFTPFGVDERKDIMLSWSARSYVFAEKAGLSKLQWNKLQDESRKIVQDKWIDSNFIGLSAATYFCSDEY